MDVTDQVQWLNSLWNVAHMHTGGTNEELKYPVHQEFTNTLLNMIKNKVPHLIRPMFLLIFEEHLRSVIIPKFWECYSLSYQDDAFKLPRALDDIYGRLKIYLSTAEKLQMMYENVKREWQHDNKTIPRCKWELLSLNIRDDLLEVLKALLFSKCPTDYHTNLKLFYSRGFSCYEKKGQIEGDCVVCSGCNREESICYCNEFLNLFWNANRQLYEMQMLMPVSKDIPVHIMEEFIEKHVLQIAGCFESSYLERLKEWVKTTVMKWLSLIYIQKEDSFTKLLEECKDRLLYMLHDIYAKVLLDQLFNIIIEFPESKRTVKDLRKCIEYVGLRPKVIASLRNTMKKRLLHPGVNTSDILTAYISSIKALKVLDKSGVIVQSVCEPICKYLRTREDTVRCIVTSLTDDSSEELAGELMKGAPLVLQENYQSEEEGEDKDWESWLPDPVDADQVKVTKGQRTSDIISMLVNIYGSKELFVNEYRILLADRLLGAFSFDTEREIRYLEMLKVRFGESHMHYCEVMLKDITDSKRINTHLNSGDLPSYTVEDFSVNAMILSAQFWPAFKEQRLKLPDYIWQHLKKFTEAFEALKGNRSLVWKPHLGVLSIEVELKERTLNLDVSPIHATILWHFQDKAQWTIAELSDKMEIQASVLRRKITFWQSYGILREEEPDVFLLVEEQESVNQDSIMVIDEERESVTASSHDQREEELQTFWSYIVGMLTNMESLPLERIHNMLRMFAMQGASTNEFTMQGMKQFLDKKVRERKLLYSSGLYRLPKFES